MRTYATAWMHSNRKLSSCVDTEGNNNPTWNDKFVFRVDEEFLRQDTSAVMIEIYANHWLRDVLVGTVRVLVGNLIPPPTLARGHQGQMRFVALQVRRPSGRPQGILNIGVALLDSSMKSMPLYRQLSMSAVGFRDLMDGSMTFQQNDNPNNNSSQVSTMKPILRRSKSERSELVALDHFSPNSSVVAIKIKPKGKDSSILSITDGVNPFQGVRKIGKASSVISGAELREKPKHYTKKGKAGSVLSDSIFSKESASFRKMAAIDLKPTKDTAKTGQGDHEKTVDEKSVTITKDNKPVVPKYKKGNSVWSDSEVGPSPSEVAAAVMAERKYPLDDNQSSVLDGWSVDESVEGLRSKLERWRMELPPLYDRTGFSSSSYTKSSAGAGRHARRHSDSESSGLFSCFGNIFGYECQCICGKPPKGKRSRSATFHSPSTLTPGRSYL
ncbi:hypothetical protein PHJA_000486000 [Phtheirospermum japonicum]|uniref:C2 domain-containing protein n=1 Tax=Phtheirospermum japonicum TaxID=374723 RepID=A0A830B8U1_9LAMI|nr:hypothetical protein PHJA_000486000 [Phtheirospermum japonicum]